MDFNLYVENIMEKLKDSGCYFEISEDEVREAIGKHLDKEYKYKIEMASFDYDIAESKGEEQDINHLKTVFTDIKSEMISVIREISRTDL